MSSIKLVGSTSGEITIAAPAVAGTNTLTLPANTGTIVTSESGVGDLPSTIAGPAFHATMSTNQSIPHATSTKLQFDTEVFDTAGNYDTSNYRFTPSVAGYYLLNASAFFNTTNSGGTLRIEFYKNGGVLARGINLPDVASTDMTSNGSYLLYLNGTTDYVEIYVYQSSGSAMTVYQNPTLTYFQAHLVRAA